MLIRTRSHETSISNCSFAGSHGTAHKALESEQDEASEKVANADVDAGVSAVTHASTEAELELYGDIYIQSEFESLSQTRQKQHLCQRELP